MRQTGRGIGRGTRVAIIAALASTMWVQSPAGAGPQNDARSGRDAGDTFESATRVKPHGYYEGRLDDKGGDSDDFYKFKLREGSSMSVLVELPSPDADPVTLLDPSGNVIDVGTKVRGNGVTVSGAFTSELRVVRLAVHRAVEPGDYRLRLKSNYFPTGIDLKEYALCFMNCEEPQKAPIELIFGGSLQTTDARVLLVPPSHGDLGNPDGPTVVDYIDATLRGMREWPRVLKKFAKDYPQYSYLKKIDFQIEIFDGADPVDPAGYDVILGYVAAGPAFRGVAGDTNTRGAVNSILDRVGIRDQVRYSGRVIALSLYGSSPRAGQVMYDFPEINDLEIVTKHEFGHTFGLGHTTTWHHKLGPDLMNSPAPFVYGDGFGFGDGGERTKMKCLTSLDLYGMAELYRWVPKGKWESSDGFVDLPKGIPYRWYC
ncbi:MAG: hypothetical protein M3280_06835 [Actinomycetota bacterium]|nr:hypothetical protein [Actinomycetota bacterium]